MKKIFIMFIICSLFSFNMVVFAYETQNVTKQAEPIDGTVKHDDAPVWAEYVAPKYRNPHTESTRKDAIKQVVWGGVLTDLIVTSPIGIPILVKGTKKLKMISYTNRKSIFDSEIEKAQYIQDDNDRAAEYKRILNKCNLKESTRKHYAKKEAKAKAKAEKKQQKNKK